MKNRLFGRLGEKIPQEMLLPIALATIAFLGVFVYNLVGNIGRQMEQERLQNMTQEQPKPDEDQVVETNDAQENVPVETAEPVQTEAEPQPMEETATEETKPTFILPVQGGKIYARFSGDELVYNRTMDDWRTHNGADIYAQKGDAVNAGADGTVKKIYCDDMLGNTVVIEHNGFEAKYRGLSKNILVAQGASVYQGQPIGTVDEVPLEVNDESHIHLEIIKDGQNVNPDSIL